MMDRREYVAIVRRYVHIARELKHEDPAITTEALVDELHEYLNAPDSGLSTWEGEDADDVRALEILAHSANRAEALKQHREQRVYGVDFGFLAAWALVADVIDHLEPAVDEGDRDSVIRWLLWNDPNGCWSDEDCREERERPMTLEEALAHYHCQKDHDPAAPDPSCTLCA